MTFLQTSAQHKSPSHESPSNSFEGESKDIILLSEEQNARLFSLMKKPVFIRSKDAFVKFNPSVAFLVDSFVHSYMMLYFAVHSMPANWFVPVSLVGKDRQLAHISSIRGSTTASLLQNGQLQDDVDIVVKFSSPIPILSDYSFFRTFCLMIGIQVFESIASKPSSIVFDDTIFMTCSYDSSRLIDKTHGIFKNFFPFPDQSKCLYSFSGLLDDRGQKRGVDLDITLVFRPEQNLRLFRPISPESTSSSSSSFAEQTTPVEVAWDMSGAQSFAHDAVEIVLPQRIDRIEKLSRAYFRALFGLDMQYIQSLLKARRLVVLDEKMHLGYRRMFYEITKGRIPLMDNQEDWVQTKKIMQILCNIEENPISKVKPGLEPLLQIAKSKAEDKEFALRLFMNGYMTTFVLVDCLKKRDDISAEDIKLYDRLKVLLHTFEREFIHDTWQEIFPLLANKISHFENPVSLIRLLYEIKAHLCPFPENSVHLSLGHKVRVAGVMDKRHGFILSRSLHLQEILLYLMQLKENISIDIYEDLLEDMLGPIKHLPIDPQTQWMFLFCLRRLEQDILCPEEISQLTTLMPSFLKTWVENSSLLETLPLHRYIITFLQKWGLSLFPKKHELSFILSIIDNKKRTAQADPILLANLLYYLIIHFLHHPSDESYDKDIAQKPSKDSAILDMLLTALSSEEYTSEPIKHFLSLLPPLAASVNQRSIKKIIPLLRRVLEKEKDHQSWHESELTALRRLVTTCVDQGHEAFLVEIFDHLSTLISIDLMPYIKKKPSLFNKLQRDLQRDIFTKALSLKDLALVEQFFTLTPTSCLEILPHACQDINALIDSSIIRENLISNTQWLCSIAERDEQLSYYIYSYLTKYLSEKSCLEFTKGFKVLWKKPLLPFLSFLDSKQLRFILRQQPQWLYEGIDSSIISLTNEQYFNLCKQTLEIDISVIKHPNFLHLNLIISEELMKRWSQNDILSLSFIDVHLPQMHSVLQSKDNKDHARYLRLIQEIHKLPIKDRLASGTKAIIHDLMYQLDIIDVSLQEFILWVIKQPINEAVIQQIDQKIAKETLDAQKFDLLSTYLSKHPPILKKLIERGKECGLKEEILHPKILALIFEKKPLLDDLMIIEYLLRNQFAETLLQKAIDSLCIDEILIEDHKQKLNELIPLLSHYEFCNTIHLLTRIIAPKTLGDRQDNFTYVLRLLIDLSQHGKHEDIHKVVYKLVTLNSACKKLYSSYLLDVRKNIFELFSYLSTSIPSQYYLKVLAATLESIDISKFPFTDELLIFSLFEREITKLCPFHKHNTPILSTELIEQSKPSLRLFITHFFSCIIKEHSSFLLLTWISFTKETIHQIFPQISTHLELLPPTFIIDLFTFLVENNTPLQSETDKEITKKCYRQLIKHDTDHYIHPATILYLSINPEDISWLEHFEMLIQRAVKSENTPLLGYIADIIQPYMQSKRWNKKKQFIANLIQEYLTTSTSLSAKEGVALHNVFKDKVPIDSHIILLSLFIKEIKKPYSEKTITDIASLILNYDSLDGPEKFTEAEIVSIKKGISQHLKDITFSQFLKHYQTLSNPIFEKYFNLCFMNILKKYAKEFMKYIFSQTVSKKLYNELILISAYLVPSTDLTDETEQYIKDILLSKTEQLLSSGSDQEEYNFCITLVLGIFLTLHNKNIERPIDAHVVDLCQKALSILHRQEFSWKFDGIFLLCYVRILHAVNASERLIEFMKKVDTHTATYPMDMQDKNVIFYLLNKSIIPAFTRDSKNPMYLTLTTSLILKSYYGQPISNEDMDTLCLQFQKHIEIFLDQPEEKEISHEITNLLLMVELLSKALNLYSNLHAYRLYFQSVRKLCQHTQINTKAMESILLCSHTAFAKIKRHEQFLKALSEINFTSKKSDLPLENTNVYQILNIIFSDAAEIIALAEIIPIPTEHREKYIVTIQVDGMVNEIKHMLFLFDQALVPEFFDTPNNLSYYLKTIPEDSLKSALLIFNLLLKKSMREHDPKIVLKYSRVFISMLAYVSKLLENKSSISSGTYTELMVLSLISTKNSISYHILTNLKELSFQVALLPSQLLNEILQLSLLRYHIVCDERADEECTLAQNIFRGELKKKDPKSLLLLQTLSYLHAICKMRPQNIQTIEIAQPTAIKLWSSLHKATHISDYIKKMASSPLMLFLHGEKIQAHLPAKESDQEQNAAATQDPNGYENDSGNFIDYLSDLITGMIFHEEK